MTDGETNTAAEPVKRTCARCVEIVEAEARRFDDGEVRCPACGGAVFIDLPQESAVTRVKHAEPSRRYRVSIEVDRFDNTHTDDGGEDEVMAVLFRSAATVPGTSLVEVFDEVTKRLGEDWDRLRMVADDVEGDDG